MQFKKEFLNCAGQQIRFSLWRLDYKTRSQKLAAIGFFTRAGVLQLILLRFSRTETRQYSLNLKLKVHGAKFSSGSLFTFKFIQFFNNT
jgi:hypothetical protein